MNAPTKFDGLEVGFDVPAPLPGMDEADIQTPCLVLDLDALERNIKKMGDYAREHGIAPPCAWQNAQIGRCGQAAKKALAAPAASAARR